MGKSLKSKNRFFDKRIGWAAFWSFFVLSVLAWTFSNQLATVLFFVPGQEIHDIFLLERATSILLMLSTFTLALLAIVSVLAYMLQKSTEVSVSRETVTDLMLSHEQFRKLYDNSPVPYLLMDDVGNIRNPNRAALRFLGGTLEECASANFYKLIKDEETSKQTMSMLRTKVERSIPISQEEMCILPLNRKAERYALVSIYSLERTSPIPFKHLVALVDISKEKESERVKTDFLLLASHQLRTPLTTVKWYIDYLLTSTKIEMSDVVKEYLEQIYIGNERMIELITTLLTVSRIEMGTLAPEYTNIHVNEIVHDILEELSTDIQKRKIEVEVRTEGSDALVMDRTMVRIIIHNLLTNAVKYTPHGGDVTISSVFSPHTCKISVTDTGHGIPADEQEKIFVKMFRASNARKVSTNGTGLGLYLSRAFAEKLGGEIFFTSEQDKGSTFTLSLPRVAPGA